MSDDVKNIVIIGTGPAGLTAAIYSARALLNPVLFAGLQPGGLLTTTFDIENFPGFENGIGGIELMQTMEAQAKRFGALIINDTIESVDFSARPFSLVTGSGETVRTQAVIIASGARPKTLDLPGEAELFGGGGVSTCATCDGFFFREKIVAVAGGGDSACEEALFLTRFASKVYLIHRRDALRASEIMQKRVFENKKIEILWDTIPVRFISQNKKLMALTIKNVKTGAGSDLSISGFFYAIGHLPNVDFLKGAIQTDENGFIIADRQQMTNIPGVFAAGDVHDSQWRQAITAAGYGCAAAISAERYLSDQSNG
ncbi:MAG: thioredoxin-disulfide reductase [Planctomycetota bacterium]